MDEALQQGFQQAFHILYDAKDKLDPGSREFYDAYLAIGAIAKLMEDLNIPIPERYDIAH